MRERRSERSVPSAPPMPLLTKRSKLSSHAIVSPLLGSATKRLSRFEVSVGFGVIVAPLRYWLVYLALQSNMGQQIFFYLLPDHLLCIHDSDRAPVLGGL